MQEVLAKYINGKRVEAGLSFEALADMCNRPESTVKNICSGKTEAPRLDTVLPIMEAIGGSFDEMLHPERSKDELKETSVLALKDIYEFQIEKINQTSEVHINNIRSHYDQHHEDLKENYERRLADKRELNEMKDEYIITLKRTCLILGVAFCVCFFILISLLIAEVMNPNLGWFRY